MERRLLKVVLIALCYMAICETSDDESIHTAREILEEVLRIPHSERVLNSVRDRLERNKHEKLLAAASVADQEEDCEDLPDVYPDYADSVVESRERGMRQLGVQKYYEICHVERKIRHLKSDEYEYKPAYYEQVECARPAYPLLEDTYSEVNRCSSLGFSCVQWNKTIHLTRRRFSSDCWETKTIQIPAGCECMWPAHKLGDIKIHV